MSQDYMSTIWDRFMTVVTFVSVCSFAHKHKPKPKCISKQKTHVCPNFVSSLPKYSPTTFDKVIREL